MIRAAALLLGACLVLPAAALAQDPVPPPLLEDPIGPFVVDARATLARFKALPAVAESLDLEATDLPTRGLGLVVGGHFYPLRSRSWALGVEHAPPAPLVLGRHLLARGIEPGPRMGEILRAVYERQLDGSVTTVEDGIAFADEYNRGSCPR